MATPTSPLPKRLFVSYSHKDCEVVACLCELIRLGGPRVFRDRDALKPGMKWREELQVALKEAECIVLFWSVNAAASDFVTEEWSTARVLEKEIAPVLLDDTPLVYPLSEYQWLDFRSFVRMKPAVKFINDMGEGGTAHGDAPPYEEIALGFSNAQMRELRPDDRETLARQLNERIDGEFVPHPDSAQPWYDLLDMPRIQKLKAEYEYEESRRELKKAWDEYLNTRDSVDVVLKKMFPIG